MRAQQPVPVAGMQRERLVTCLPRSGLEAAGEEEVDYEAWDALIAAVQIAGRTSTDPTGPWSDALYRMMCAAQHPDLDASLDFPRVQQLDEAPGLRERYDAGAHRQPGGGQEGLPAAHRDDQSRLRVDREQRCVGDGVDVAVGVAVAAGVAVGAGVAEAVRVAVG